MYTSVPTHPMGAEPQQNNDAIRLARSPITHAASLHALTGNASNEQFYRKEN